MNASTLLALSTMLATLDDMYVGGLDVLPYACIDVTFDGERMRLTRTAEGKHSIEAPYA